MRLCILGPGERYIKYTTKRLLEEARKEFKTVDLVPLVDVTLTVEKGVEATYQKENLQKYYDYALPRIDSKRAGIGYPVMRFLDALGMRKPYPAETILIAHNKFITLEVLARAGVRVPKSFMTGSKAAAQEIIKKEKLPIILKLLSGFGGQGIMFMDSREAAQTAIDTMRTLKQEILLEEYIENPGEDIRGVVAGDEIIASYKRIAAPGEKKANYHSGGRARTFTLSREMEEIVFKSAEAINAKICAIDMIQGKQGIFVIEVNINPGMELLEKTTNINVAQRVISYIKSEVKR